MSDSELSGYHEYPKNGFGIIRAHTTLNLFSWELPRSEKALEVVNDEFNKADYPSLYILFDDNAHKCYVGEAKTIYNRLRTHMATPEDKIKGWKTAIIINDGRAANQSQLNDTVVRKYLELYLIRLLKANKHTVVAQGESQNLNAVQKALVDKFVREVTFLLMKKNIITKELEEKKQELVYDDDLKRILTDKGMTIGKWTAAEAQINNGRVFIRRGSKKAKGWQITFRDIFKDCLEQTNGHLLVPRDGVLLIPFSEVKKVISDDSAFKQNTIDVYINFEETSATLTYKENTIDVSKFKIL